MPEETCTMPTEAKDEVSVETLGEVLKYMNTEYYQDIFLNSIEKESFECTFQSHNEEWLYQHCHYGTSLRRSGMIQIFRFEKPKWTMNYNAVILDDSVNSNEVWVFLKEMMLNTNDLVIPFYGHECFEKGNWNYQACMEGGFDRFRGTGSAFKNGSLILSCFFSGLKF